jgi:hypothetical protein
MRFFQAWSSFMLLLLVGLAASAPKKAVPVKKPAAAAGAVEPASGMKVVVGEVLSDEGQADEAALKAVDDDLSKMMDQPHHTTESDTAESFVEQVKEADAEEKATKDESASAFVQKVQQVDKEKTDDDVHAKDAEETKEVKEEVEDEAKKEDADDHVNHPVMLDAPQEDEEAEKAFKRSRMNNYRANMAYVCPTGRAFSTLLSSFYPSYYDRSWSGQCDRYLPKGYVGPRFWTTNYGYDNEYRGTLNAYCPPQSIMSGMAAVWSSGYKDRRYKLYCNHIWHHRHHSCKWSPWMNNWRESAHFTLSCNDQYYMVGMQGYFHSSYYDRRFRIYMCKLQKI